MMALQRMQVQTQKEIDIVIGITTTTTTTTITITTTIMYCLVLKSPLLPIQNALPTETL
jgi:hypothetical protein